MLRFTKAGQWLGGGSMLGFTKAGQWLGGGMCCSITRVDSVWISLTDSVAYGDIINVLLYFV